MLRIAWFMFGVVLFILNVLSGLHHALAGSGWVFLNILAILAVAAALDDQLSNWRNN
jgi:hypothetical protein